jgi:hypothetical protein
MPIEHDIQTRMLSADEFHQLDYRVMASAFAAHNELGRMCKEAVYREFVRHRCAVAGLDPVRKGVGIWLAHERFRKPLYMDLLVHEGVIYELP